MRAVIQRVSRAKVTVGGGVAGEIYKGIMVLIGINSTDDEKVIDYMIDKIINLRIFEDNEGKMNLSLADIQGELLVVPNFTLYGDARKGRRPGYSSGAKPSEAEGIFKRFTEKISNCGLKVETGIFQAEMQVELVNDGPVTLLLDSDKIF